MTTQSNPTFNRWIKKQIAAVMEKKINHAPLSMREKTLYVFSILNEIENLQPYMHKLITDATQRVFHYRERPYLFDFGHNEAIMIGRLYEDVK